LATGLSAASPPPLPLTAAGGSITVLFFSENSRIAVSASTDATCGAWKTPTAPVCSLRTPTKSTNMPSRQSGDIDGIESTAVLATSHASLMMLACVGTHASHDRAHDQHALCDNQRH
jgi:hypothetical protein